MFKVEVAVGKELRWGIDSPFDSIFWAAPTITANIRGVVPILAVMGAKKAGKRFSEKNMAPVTRRVTGVIRAATPHPNF